MGRFGVAGGRQHSADGATTTEPRWGRTPQGQIKAAVKGETCHQGWPGLSQHRGEGSGALGERVPPQLLWLRATLSQRATAPVTR